MRGPASLTVLAVPALAALALGGPRLWRAAPRDPAPAGAVAPAAGAQDSTAPAGPPAAIYGFHRDSLARG